MPIPFMWLHLASNHLKNIWSEIEMIKCHLYLIFRSESETKLPQIGSNFTRSWLPCEVKSASAGWWARFWRAGIEHESLYTQTQTRSDFCCSKYTNICTGKILLLSCFWEDVPFQGFVLHDAQTRWLMAEVSAAYAASTCLRSSRSLHLSLRSTAQSFEQVTWWPVKHRLIESCLFYCTCKQKHRFCWLPSVSHHLETDDSKNIWSEI